jgi:hypothetical protein
MRPAATRAALATVAVAVIASSCGGSSTDSAAIEQDAGTVAVTAPAATTFVEHDADEVVARDPDVPELPFDDNPDPNACGIPMRWGDDSPAWLTGVWEGELIQPDVLLYDSHLRQSVAGQAPNGAEVRVVLFQQNPTLDYYLVEAVDDPTQEGWVPAPFLTFDPIT